MILMPWPLKSQETRKKAEWLPKGNLFPTFRLDYKESQFSGGLYGFYTSGKWQNRVFAMFSAGLRRNIIRWQHKNDKASELGFEVCVFPQFLIEKPFETFRVNFFNIDFKVGLQYQFRINDHWRLRGRFYHVSAHLGDDYIFRYEIEHYIINYRIYEMLDFSAAWLKDPLMVYGTFGCIVHSTYGRSPLLSNSVDNGKELVKNYRGSNGLPELISVVNKRIGSARVFIPEQALSLENLIVFLSPS